MGVVSKWGVKIKCIKCGKEETTYIKSSGHYFAEVSCKDCKDIEVLYPVNLVKRP